MTPAELVGLARQLIAEVARWREEHEKVSEALAGARVEIQTLKDEIARLKHLPPRPPHKPSGMEKATERPRGAEGEDGKASKRRRGPGVSKLTVNREVTLTVDVPAGSRFTGYEEITVQDLMLKAETTLYRRERWQTPDGKRLTAPLEEGIIGGCGPHLVRFVLALHFEGQMTCERIVALLAGMGLSISKRQVVRLLAAKFVFRRGKVTPEAGDRRPKLTPRFPVWSAACLGAKRAVGDADCGDDRSDTARASGQGEVDQGDLADPASVAQHGAADPAVGGDGVFL